VGAKRLSPGQARIGDVFAPPAMAERATRHGRAGRVSVMSGAAATRRKQLAGQ
jgi:hypothetical protein